MTGLSGAEPVSPAAPQLEGAEPLNSVETASFAERHPILAHALESAGTSFGLSALGRGMMLGAPLTGPAAPFVEGAGAALSSAPVANALLAGGSGAAGEAVREGGRPLLGKATEPVATAIELGGPLAGARGVRGLYEAALGTPSAVAEKLAPVARKLGFILEPGQVKAGGGISASGGTAEAAKHNQLMANRLTSREAGLEADSLGPEYMKERFKTLGKEFDQIYAKGNIFAFDQAGVDKLVEAMTAEEAVGTAAGVPSIKSAVKAVLGPQWQTVSNVMNSAMPPQIKQQVVSKIIGQGGIKIDGEQLRRLRANLGNVAQYSSDGNARFAARQVMGMVDEAVKATDPAIAHRLDVLRPKYRSLLTIDEVSKGGGVPEGNVSLENLGGYLRRDDIGFTRGQSSNPLAPLGHIGETFGIRAIGQTQQMDKDTAALLKKAVEKIGLPVSGGGIGAVLGTAAGLPPAAGATIGAAAGKAVDVARRGRIGQTVQMLGAERMRQPAKFPYSSTMSPEIIQLMRQVGGSQESQQ